ncbi:probable E3 ubiquitin ligase complex SCF subunit sconB [Strongylocentrotus purpuratus]|uniref:F-box domain-containing protein n=1 Tax=Strongylocentrotus purpuratus TaxID=7668 RepID=A0A7M7PH44_STRPU|nr:probable E3 ubiquitin ligase complex SCF subunit sconB [Strongylocentrotus purpuratus]XP_800063.3 probable E3 ubiquitin ligase complex SCF subunit sconB [Strongylocentrotus purpuratus]
MDVLPPVSSNPLAADPTPVMHISLPGNADYGDGAHNNDNGQNGVEDEKEERGGSGFQIGDILLSGRSQSGGGGEGDGAVMLADWHAFRGRDIESDNTMEFNRQVDHVNIWLDKWNHNQRCLILEGILQRSNYTQYNFLWTTLQPALHRDFMYTARQHYPEYHFEPISSHTSRETRTKRAVRNYYHAHSAHLQRKTDVKRLNVQHILPVIMSAPSEEPKEVSFKSGWDRLRPTNSMPLVKLPSVSHSKTFDHPLSKSAPVSPMRDDQPIRRHMQDHDGHSIPRKRVARNERKRRGYNPVDDANVPLLTKALTDVQLTWNRPTMSGNRADRLPPIEPIPVESWQLFHWYAECWNDVQRNEFLHKLLKKLDQRQLYFLSTHSALKQSRDFITLLPLPLALRIMGYLSPRWLLVAAQVCKMWNRRASHDQIWKDKCSQVAIEIPLPETPFQWKKIYRDNVFLRFNWDEGKTKNVDVRGHASKVHCVTFDGEYRIASGSADKTVKVWDIRTGACIQTLKGHQKGVWCLRFFTKHLLISASYDATIKVWNLRKGACARTLLGHEGAVWSMALKKNYLATASQDRTVKLWDLSTCELKHTLVGHGQAVFCVDMDEECTMVISGSADKSVRIWSVETGRHTRVIRISQTTSVMALNYHQGYFVCSVGEIVSLWRLDTATCVKTFEEHEKRVETLSLRISKTTYPDKPQGLLVSAGQDGMVKYWDLEKDSSWHSMKSRKGSHISSIFCDKTKIIAACSDFRIRIWNFHT